MLHAEQWSDLTGLLPVESPKKKTGRLMTQMSETQADILCLIFQRDKNAAQI